MNPVAGLRAWAADEHVHAVPDPSAPLVADWLATCVREAKFRYRNEAELHRGLAMMFALTGVPLGREVWLAPESRIDFLVHRVGIEVKIKGSTPRVEEQLRRYAASGKVDVLLLITSRAKHRRLDGISLPGPRAVPLLAVDGEGNEQATDELRHIPVKIARLPWM